MQNTVGTCQKVPILIENVNFLFCFRRRALSSNRSSWHSPSTAQHSRLASSAQHRQRCSSAAQSSPQGSKTSGQLLRLRHLSQQRLMHVPACRTGAVPAGTRKHMAALSAVARQAAGDTARKRVRQDDDPDFDPKNPNSSSSSKTKKAKPTYQGVKQRDSHTYEANICGPKTGMGRRGLQASLGEWADVCLAAAVYTMISVWWVSVVQDEHTCLGPLGWGSMADGTKSVLKEIFAFHCYHEALQCMMEQLVSCMCLPQCVGFLLSHVHILVVSNTMCCCCFVCLCCRHVCHS
jgi:hypothetical protein